MITKFKIFESGWNPIYKPGDYIVLDIDKIKANFVKYDFDGYLPIDNIALITKYYHDRSNYQIEFFNGMDDDFFLIDDGEIIRKANEEEIQDFECKKDTIKYNV